MNVETFDNTEAWVGEAISKGMRRHQNIKWGLGHLRRYYGQGIPRNNVSSGQ